MNSSFFRTTSTIIFISIVFIILCFSTMYHTLSYNNEITFNNSNIIISEGIIINFSSSRLYLAYSSDIPLLHHILGLEILQLLEHPLIIPVLILVHHKEQIFWLFFLVQLHILVLVVLVVLLLQ